MELIGGLKRAVRAGILIDHFYVARGEAGFNFNVSVDLLERKQALYFPSRVLRWLYEYAIA